MLPTSLSKPPVVTTKQGRIQGHWKTVNTKIQDTQNVAEFYEIPYACPPIGKLRFQKPVPLTTSWTDTKICPEKPTKAAPQPFFRAYGGTIPREEIMVPNENQTEDCLFLNVWSPRKNSNKLLPVMVWIYGGGFVTGSASLDVYNGSVLSAVGEVVVVTVNYRLGPLGFMPITNKIDGNDVVVANQALWDQRQALIWVQENIEVFGGDRKNVCLFGESAGAMCTSLHLISPQSKGLFHKAIMQSGSPIASWIRENVDQLLENKLKMANNLIKNYGEKYGETPEEILENIPSNILIDNSFVGQQGYLKFSWTPCIDGDFLPNDPKQYLIENSQNLVPFIIGANRDEATFFYLYGGELDREKMVIPDEKLEKVFAYSHRTEEGSELYNSILQQYSSNSKTLNHEILFDSVGDRYFKGDPIRTLQVCRSSPAAWIYLFSHRSSQNTWPSWCGVMHVEDIEFVFGIPLRSEDKDNSKERMDDVKVSQQIVSMWTNFAKSTNPSIDNIQWTKAWDGCSSTDGLPKFLEMTAKSFEVKTDEKWVENANFFDKILS